MMHTLSKTELYNQAFPALHRIFKNTDPYGEPFAPDVEVKLVVHEYRYMLEPPLLDAIINACTQFGEHGFYVSVIDETNAEDQNLAHHWFVPIKDTSSYFSLSSVFIPPAYNVTYSQGGLWAIMGSDEHFGLFGASTEFVEVVRKVVTDLDDQVNGFLDEWAFNKNNYGSNISWILGLLTNVYNRETAEQLLQKFDLM